MKRIVYVLLITLVLLVGCQSVPSTSLPTPTTVFVTATAPTSSLPSNTPIPVASPTKLIISPVLSPTPLKTIPIILGVTSTPTVPASIPSSVACSGDPSDTRTVGFKILNYVGGNDPIVILIDGSTQVKVEPQSINGTPSYACIDLTPGIHKWDANLRGKGSVYGEVTVVTGIPLAPLNFCIVENRFVICPPSIPKTPTPTPLSGD